MKFKLNNMINKIMSNIIITKISLINKIIKTKIKKHKF